MALSNAERQARWRARHPEAARLRWRKSRRKSMLGWVRQALAAEHYELPAELAAMVVPLPSDAEVEAARARNLAKARARVARRRARYGGGPE